MNESEIDIFEAHKKAKQAARTGIIFGLGSAGSAWASTELGYTSWFLAGTVTIAGLGLAGCAGWIYKDLVKIESEMNTIIDSDSRPQP
jgi:hypothetical protein